ncbi:speckle-type POZ protein-like [Belonocnema kinseyi]|uniref:speckle-type POZ protein-like n=1 Tax=Belonocnema kinseyi TaxID=2817044 RepID=UPI00143D44EE|nr:speckle-type POZ protein-like [Belonocnema kinseyi]
MTAAQLAIINKEFPQHFSLRGGTVTIHPVNVSTYTCKSSTELTFEKFSLLDDPSVKCLPKLKNHTVFELCFSTNISLTSHYEVSLYCFQKPCRLIHVKTVNMNKILQSSTCNFDIHNLTTNALNEICQSYLLCTQICRKAVPYNLKKEPSFHPSQMTDCSQLLDDNAIVIFKFIHENREFWVHKEILSAKSPLFLAMFKGEIKEKSQNQIIIEDIDSNLLQEMVRYIYSDTVKELTKYAEKLLKVADKYDIPKLKLLCSEELSRSLKIKNVIHLLELADQCHESSLKEKTLKFIQSNVKLILQTENYKIWCQTAPGYLMAEILETIVNCRKRKSRRKKE